MEGPAHRSYFSMVRLSTPPCAIAIDKRHGRLCQTSGEEGWASMVRQTNFQTGRLPLSSSSQALGGIYSILAARTVNTHRKEKDLACKRGLAGVNVPGEHNVQVVPVGVVASARVRYYDTSLSYR